MRIRLMLALALILGVSGPAFADRRSDAKEQLEFGITVAQRGLWKEAALRWERAAEVDPTYSAAWNNLGIGYEQLGRFDDARQRVREGAGGRTRTTLTSATTTISSGKSMTARTVVAIVSTVVAFAARGVFIALRDPGRDPDSGQDRRRCVPAGAGGRVSERWQPVDRCQYRDGAPVAQPAPEQTGTPRHRRRRPGSGRGDGPSAGRDTARAGNRRHGHAKIRETRRTSKPTPPFSTTRNSGRKSGRNTRTP